MKQNVWGILLNDYEMDTNIDDMIMRLCDVRKEYGDVTLNLEKDWDSCTVTLQFFRPESDVEYRARTLSETALQAKNEAADRVQFEKLKKKFGDA